MAQETMPSARPGRLRRGSRLGIRSSLLLMVLVPTIATVALASSAAASKWTDRDNAVATRSATFELDLLMHARAAVTEEYVSSAAVAYANSRGIGIDRLDQMLGIDFAADLANARRLVDRQLVMRRVRKLATDYEAVVSLRAHLDAHAASFADVQQVFVRFTNDIDADWTAGFDGLTKRAGLAGPATTRLETDVTALRVAFSAFTAGLGQSTYAQEILTSPSSPAIVADLIGTDELYTTSTAGFPGELGKQAAAAWEALRRNPLIRRFDEAVRLAVNTGLHRAPPPYATNIAANAAVFRGLIAKVSALTNLVLGASADLRSTAAGEENSATNSLVTEVVLLVVLVVLVFAAALWLARSVSRPLARIASAAGAVQQGDLDVPPLESTGPRELASAALAFNEMTSTLGAVEAHAVALASRDLDDPVLQVPLPGRTGRALQGALDRLQESVRDAEQQRAELHTLAIHDSLTGLLNRGAAVDAMERALAQAARLGQRLALLFIDLDGLKAINDTFGHQGGDEALRAVADAISSTTRRADVRARLGGDEFVVAQLGAGSNSDISALAERIRQRVAAAEPELLGHRIAIRCSIGIAESYPDEASADALIQRADSALYEAKQAGRNRVAWFRPPEIRSA